MRCRQLSKNECLPIRIIKKTFTAKVLIGCAPSGLISFKSPCAGRKKTDAQITVESGLIDLLESDDLVLADKGFPEIKAKLDEKGKKVILDMPSILYNPEFTQEEVEETYSIANVRIHIESIMLRIKLFKILQKIPCHLFPYIDSIVNMCCIFVNLQPAIINQNIQKT